MAVLEGERDAPARKAGDVPGDRPAHPAQHHGAVRIVGDVSPVQVVLGGELVSATDEGPDTVPGAGGGEDMTGPPSENRQLMVDRG